MKRFKKILCYVGGDGDPSPGLETATELALNNDASLTLIDVLPKANERPWLTVLGKPELDEMVVSTRLREIEELAEQLRSQGLEVEAVVTTGSPFIELIRRVVVNGNDLVIKTAQGTQGRFSNLLGTTALHLMRKCPAPVWVVKPKTDSERPRVLAAVDPRPDVPGVDHLSIKVLELASSLARAQGATLDVVHAWWLYSESILRGNRINMPPAEVDGLLREVRGQAEGSLDALLDYVDLSGVDWQSHLVKGLPHEVIDSYAKKADTIVMGTLSRTGVEGLLIGNTAEWVLRRVDCSVLTVKPLGFVTPLQFEESLVSAESAV